MKTPMNELITMFKKQFNFLSMAVHPFPNTDLLISYKISYFTLYYNNCIVFHLFYTVGLQYMCYN